MFRFKFYLVVKDVIMMNAKYYFTSNELANESRESDWWVHRP